MQKVLWTLAPWVPRAGAEDLRGGAGAGKTGRFPDSLGRRWNEHPPPLGDPSPRPWEASQS